jgi:hypothetical protein
VQYEAVITHFDDVRNGDWHSCRRLRNTEIDSNAGKTGEPRDIVPPVFIHVGFANTGTTGLQHNFFTKRDDIFYVGEPYGEFGGIFTTIKNIEDFNLNFSSLARLCNDLVVKKSGGRPIVVSDETLTETPQLYFAPYTMPRDMIALRLHQLFPFPKIIFTIRDQRRYAESMYLNLKRNAAHFDRMPVPPFSQWLGGALSLWRAHYLQNLNFFECISLYTRIFGRENICVMPLEMAVNDGARPYLARLCDFMGLELRASDVANFVRVHNRRMSQQQARAAELLSNDRFQQFYADLREALGAAQLAAVLEKGPRSSVAMRPEDEEKICQQVDLGNRLIAEEFRLDLARYGYPLADGYDLTEDRLAAAKQEFSAAARELSHEEPLAEETVEVHRSAEIVALRARLAELVNELEKVGHSPVWRIVKRIENARRVLVRVAATVYSSTERGRSGTLANGSSPGISRNAVRLPEAPARMMRQG